MSDKYDEQAEALLPCSCGGVFVDGVINETLHDDRGECPAYFRPVVAAALREKERE